MILVEVILEVSVGEFVTVFKLTIVFCFLLNGVISEVNQFI